MDIHIDRLIEILTEHGGWSTDASPREAIYIRFYSEVRPAKLTRTFHTVDGSLLAIDVSDDETILGIEIT